jgi:uncharacterized protein (DUF1778 family)
LSAQQDALIRQAADLENTTVTAFMLDSVTARAQQVVSITVAVFRSVTALQLSVARG